MAKVIIQLKCKIAKVCNSTGISLTSVLLYFSLHFKDKLIQDTTIWMWYSELVFQIAYQRGAARKI